MATPEELEQLRTDAEETTRAAIAAAVRYEMALRPAFPAVASADTTGRAPHVGDDVLYWPQAARRGFWPAKIQCVFSDCVRLWVFGPDAVELCEAVTQGDHAGQWRWRD